MKKNLIKVGAAAAVIGAIFFTVVPASFAIANEKNTEIAADNPVVAFKTNLGDIKVELDAVRAPFTTINFIHYVKKGHYDGTIFHRVIPNFMIQGGGFTTDYEKKLTDDMIPNEADNGLKNLSGTIAMARTRDPHSATAQFFINTTDNGFLDHTQKTPRGWGYAVFGHVIDGMDVVRKIEHGETGAGGMFSTDVPKEMVIIESVQIISK